MKNVIHRRRRKFFCFPFLFFSTITSCSVVFLWWSSLMNWTQNKETYLYVHSRWPCFRWINKDFLGRNDWAVFLFLFYNHSSLLILTVKNSYFLRNGFFSSSFLSVIFIVLRGQVSSAAKWFFLFYGDLCLRTFLFILYLQNISEKFEWRQKKWICSNYEGFCFLLRMLVGGM